MSKEEEEPERTADNGLHSDYSDDSDASDKDSDKLPHTAADDSTAKRPFCS
jgi:hypothetical protein